MSAQVDVVILGAGLAGITAGITLQNAGRQVLLLDKGVYPGGRVMSTRAHEHLFNPSVSRAEITNPEVLSFLESNVSTELRDQIQTDFGVQLDSLGRELALHLSKNLTINRTFVTHGILEITPGHPAPVGFGSLGNGPSFLANHALLTAPVPQSLEILRAGGIRVPDAPNVAYSPRLVVMCEVEGELSSLEEHPESRIIDTIRIEPTDESRAFLTVYSRNEWASQVWDHDANMSHAQLLLELAKWFPAVTILGSQAQRWTYADAISQHPEAFAVVRDGQHKVLLAGDAFGPEPGREFGVQRAINSGLKCATHLINASD